MSFDKADSSYRNLNRHKSVPTEKMNDPVIDISPKKNESHLAVIKQTDDFASFQLYNLKISTPIRQITKVEDIPILLAYMIHVGEKCSDSLANLRGLGPEGINILAHATKLDFFTELSNYSE